MKQKAIVFDSKDNVATALAGLDPGTALTLVVGGRRVVTKINEHIPFGHKFSITSIESNSPVIKYGEIIGIATNSIKPGFYVHTHNVASARGRGDLTGRIAE